MTTTIHAPEATATVTLSEHDRVRTLALCVMAAMSDGGKSEAERTRLRAMVDEIGASAKDDVASLYGKAAMGTLDVAQVARELSSPEAREHAFQMAVLTCEADGVLDEAEKKFLASLQNALGIREATASATLGAADELLAVNLATPPAAVAGLLTTPPPLPVSAAGAKAALDAATSKEIDSTILTYSVLNAALELLPQNLSTAAIIPLQVKMVYGVGSRYGFALDAGHIRDFLATIGIGATSQVLESYARRLLGGVLDKYGGSIGGKLGGLLGGSIGASVARSTGSTAGTAVEWGTGPLMTFATTYAIGQVAKAYYGAGRTLSTEMLRRIFSEQTHQATTIYEQYRPQIEQQAKGINPAQIMGMLTGR
jgi:uncharacterized protein (DUF697 family)/tellurite resistance protein